MIRTREERDEGIKNSAESAKRYALSPLTCTKREDCKLNNIKLKNYSIYFI
jgi:hypothetical protein